MQRLTAQNALRIGSGRPLHVGPITLKASFNAVATSEVTNEANEDTGTDPLQGDPFAAAWLLGSVAALSTPGVESISYFETSGPRGIVTEDGLTPAGDLLAALAVLRGKEVLTVDGQLPGLVLYPVRSDGNIVILAANLTPHLLSTTISLPNNTRHALAFEPWSATIDTLPAPGFTTGEASTIQERVKK